MVVLSALAVLASGCGNRERPPAGANAPATFGFGRPATAPEIAAWDVDVRPDGVGLPPGSGAPSQGAAIYAHKCAACHGTTGTEGPFDRLVGREPRDGFPFGRDPRLVKNSDNNWTFPPALYDNVNLHIPPAAPGPPAA